MKLGNDRCQCAGCGNYFRSTAAFDKHRTGKAGERRCRSTDEMLARGMVRNAGGWWVSSAAKMPAELILAKLGARARTAVLGG